MFPKISNSLLNSVKSLNRISELYRLQIETVQAMSNALSVYNSQMNAISQSISNNLRMYHNIASTVSPLIQVYQNQINITVSNFENIKVWDNFINLAVSAYQNSQEEEFEIEIENIPVIISKAKIQDIFKAYLNIGIEKENAFKMAIATIILFSIYPVIFMFRQTEFDIIKYISDYIYFLGGAILRKAISKIESFNNPENLADFLVDEGASLLFALIIELLKKLKW